MVFVDSSPTKQTIRSASDGGRNRWAMASRGATRSGGVAVMSVLMSTHVDSWCSCRIDAHLRLIEQRSRRASSRRTEQARSSTLARAPSSVVKSIQHAIQIVGGEAVTPMSRAWCAACSWLMETAADDLMPDVHRVAGQNGIAHRLMTGR